MDRRHWHGRRRSLAIPEVSEVAGTMGGWLRDRSQGSGLEALVAGRMLDLVRHSAHILNEMGAGLERAIEPPVAPRPRRRATATGKAASRRPRTRKPKPDSPS